MKKHLLILAGAAIAASAYAQSAAPEFMWANLLDGLTAAGDNAIGNCVGLNHSVAWLGTYGSNDAQGSEITYAGAPLFNGASYSGTSNNGNLTLLKTNYEGNKEWVVYPDSGDWLSSQGGVATTSEGSLIFAAKVRHTDGHMDIPIKFHDVDGETDLEWIQQADDTRCYRIVVGKVSNEGALEWLRTIEVGLGKDAENPVSDGATLGNITIDNNDNIYLALGHSTDLSVPTEDGASHVVATNPDAVSVNGVPTDFLTLSLDADGYYRNALTLTGTPAEAKCAKVEWLNGNLYIQGTVRVDGDAALSVGGKALKASALTSPVVMRTDADFNISWAKCFTMTEVGGKGTMQNAGLSEANGVLWFCGMYNGQLNDPDDASKFVASTQEKIREGYIIKLDAATGEWLAARNSRDDEFCNPSALAKTGLTGYLEVIASPYNSDKIYVFGYVMNLNVGVFLREYDANTLEANVVSGEHNVITGGGVPTAMDCAFDATSGYVYISARGNKAFVVDGEEMQTAPNAWGVLLSAFRLPDDMTTGVESVEVSNTDGDEEVEYFNLQGMRVKNPGEGIYIRRQGNKAVKVIRR